MAIARFKDLCLDAGAPARLGTFWATVLGRTWQAQDNGEGLLTGPAAQHTIWINRVREVWRIANRTSSGADMRGHSAIGQHAGEGATARAYRPGECRES
jgi:hypothetical protein